jgi:hypothetical protein
MDADGKQCADLNALGCWWRLARALHCLNHGANQVQLPRFSDKDCRAKRSAMSAAEQAGHQNLAVYFVTINSYKVWRADRHANVDRLQSLSTAARRSGAEHPIGGQVARSARRQTRSEGSRHRERLDHHDCDFSSQIAARFADKG